MATTVNLPLEFRNPQVSTNAGSAYFTVAQLTSWDAGYFVFDKTGNLDVVWYGIGWVPSNMAATPNAKIKVYWTANSTVGSNIRTQISSAVVKDAHSTNMWNPTSLTAETAATSTLSTTAWRQLAVTSGNLTNQPAASDSVIVKIMRVGSDTTNDTLAATTPLFMFGAFLQIDIN